MIQFPWPFMSCDLPYSPPYSSETQKLSTVKVSCNHRPTSKRGTYLPSLLRTRPSRSKDSLFKLLVLVVGIGSVGSIRLAGRTPIASRPVVAFPNRSLYKRVDLYDSESVCWAAEKGRLAAPSYGVRVNWSSCCRPWKSTVVSTL